MFDKLTRDYISFDYNKNHSSKDTLLDEVKAELLKVLPHGSGIDSDWKFSEFPMGSPDTIECYNSYHVLDGSGYYAGWIDFTVTLNLLSLTFDVKVNQEHVGLIEQSYSVDDDEDSEYDNHCPYLDDLEDYIYQTVECAIDDYLIDETFKYLKLHYKNRFKLEASML